MGDTANDRGASNHPRKRTRLVAQRTGDGQPPFTEVAAVPRGELDNETIARLERLCIRTP